MTTKQQIEKEIEAAFESVDHLASASPAPFFYTRLTARMMKEEKNIWGRLSRTISRPAVAGFAVALIIAVNVLAVMHHTPKSSGGVPDQAEIAVADEYNRTTSLYDIDNVQP